MIWHEAAECFDPLSDEEYFRLKASIKENGQIYKVKYREVNGKKQGLDGRHRWRACQELGIPCAMEKVEVEDTKVWSYMRGCNDARRMSSPEKIAERMRELHEEGFSTREIAETVGASQTTVQRAVGPKPPPKKTNPDNGKLLPDLNGYKKPYGDLMKWIDKVEIGYELRDKPHGEGLRRSLDIVLKDIELWIVFIKERK